MSINLSAFDRIYRSAVPLKLFSKGWGETDLLMKLLDNIDTVQNRERFLLSFDGDASVSIDKRTEYKGTIITEGSFISPFVKILPDSLQRGNDIARFQLLTPKIWPNHLHPMCLHFSGTGDHSYSRRRYFLANRLVQDGIGSIIIMNPYYWKRKPESQRGSSLNYVSDLFVMGGALIMECFALLTWCERNGYGPFALHGISMGGYMASLCATVWPKPISLIPCLSWSTASIVFLEGIMSHAVDWCTLTRQYYSDAVYEKLVRPRVRSQASSIPSRQPSTDLSSVATSSKEKQISPSESAPMQGIDFTDVSHATTEENPIKLRNTAKLSSLRFSSSSFADLVWKSGADLGRILPDVLSYTSEPPVDPEVRQFLRELLDKFTYLGNFSPLLDPRLVFAVTAENDAYVPREGVVSLSQVFPGCELRFIPHTGHVGAYLRNAIWTEDFYRAVTDCINKQVELHYSDRSERAPPRAIR